MAMGRIACCRAIPGAVASRVCRSDSIVRQLAVSRARIIAPVVNGAGAPVVFGSFALVGGRAERRTRDASAASCAVEWEAHERSHHESTGSIRRSARSGFHGLLRTAPGGRAVVAHRYRGLPAPPALKRGPALPAAAWREASRQDRRLGPSARGVVVIAVNARSVRRRKFRAGPAIEHRARPPHPAPRIVTIAKRPSVWSGISRNIILDRKFVKGGFDVIDI